MDMLFFSAAAQIVALLTIIRAKSKILIFLIIDSPPFLTLLMQYYNKLKGM
jgi:hypothetical protein